MFDAIQLTVTNQIAIFHNEKVNSDYNYYVTVVDISAGSTIRRLSLSEGLASTSFNVLKVLILQNGNIFFAYGFAG